MQITQEEFDKIKELHNQGLSVKEIIKQSGRSDWTVYTIKRVGSLEEFKNYRSKETVINKTTGRKLPKTIQVNILSRFLKGTELKNLFENYEKNLKSMKGVNREVIFKQPITSEDLELLRIYTTEFGKTLREVAEERNIKIASLSSRIPRIAIKVITQFPEILDQIETRD